jgi:predicted esterase
VYRAIAVLGFAAACKSDGGGAEKDAVGDDDDDDVVGVQWPNDCTAPGPDEPATIIPPARRGVGVRGLHHVHQRPEGARGLLVYFHGGGSVDEILQAEHLVFFEFLASRGWGVAATQRTLPGEQDNWDSSRSLVYNQDMARVTGYLEQVKADHGLSDDLPIATVGFSDGGIMAMAYAYTLQEEGFPVVAALVHNGAFSDSVGPVPAMFVQGEHDHEMIPEIIADRLRRDGVRTEVRYSPERTTTPEVFLRVPLWDLSYGERAVADLLDKGLIDADGARVVSDSNMELALTAWQNFSEIDVAPTIAQRMRVVWSMHRVSAYDLGDECTFLLDSLP